MRTLADAAIVALLYDLGDRRQTKLASLYARYFLTKEEYPAWAMRDEEVWQLEGQSLV